MEFPILIAFFAYLFYLKNYVDHRTPFEKETDRLSEGTNLFKSGDIRGAFEFFNRRIERYPKSCASYLYRGQCYHLLGDPISAARDFQSGISYDNTVPELYIELGKLQQKESLINESLASFENAIRVSGGQISEPYYLRGSLYQVLGRISDAHHDFETERGIKKEIENMKSELNGTPKSPLFDRRLILNSLLVVVGTAILVLVIKYAASIHLPYISAVALSVAIGFAEPRRGWILAILQTILLYVGYTFFTEAPGSRARQELEYFSLYGALSLIFAASYLGAFLKKAIDS